MRTPQRLTSWASQSVTSPLDETSSSIYTYVQLPIIQHCLDVKVRIWCICWRYLNYSMSFNVKLHSPIMQYISELNKIEANLKSPWQSSRACIQTLGARLIIKAKINMYAMRQNTHCPPGFCLLLWDVQLLKGKSFLMMKESCYTTLLSFWFFLCRWVGGLSF